MGFIFYLSSLDEIPGPESVTEHSYLGHFLIYCVLGILLRRAMINVHPAATIACGFLYGASDEFHQYFVPPRSSSLSDLAVDLVGVVCGVLLFSRARRQD